MNGCYGVNEMAWLDMGSADPAQPSNLTDSEAFAALGHAFRGKATQDATKTLDSTPPNAQPSESFFKAAGCEIIAVAYCGVTSAKRQIMNQADIFYYSGHGHHDINNLDGGFTPAMAGGMWNKDLDCVILAGCSVLDINDYNNNYIDDEQSHHASPGKAWELTAQTCFLAIISAHQEIQVVPLCALCSPGCPTAARLAMLTHG